MTASWSPPKAAAFKAVALDVVQAKPYVPIHRRIDRWV
jgi:hypothetical protein